jgi:hypothetical protein
MWFLLCTGKLQAILESTTLVDVAVPQFQLCMELSGTKKALQFSFLKLERKSVFES